MGKCICASCFSARPSGATDNSAHRSKGCMTTPCQTGKLWTCQSQLPRTLQIHWSTCMTSIKDLKLVKSHVCLSFAASLVVAVACGIICSPLSTQGPELLLTTPGKAIDLGAAGPGCMPVEGFSTKIQTAPSATVARQQPLLAGASGCLSHKSQANSALHVEDENSPTMLQVATGGDGCLAGSKALVKKRTSGTEVLRRLLQMRSLCQLPPALPNVMAATSTSKVTHEVIQGIKVLIRQDNVITF